MVENFDEWNELKKVLNKNKQPPTFKEREIWWCSVGVNVGYEVYGKGKIFSRPVLVIKKFSNYSFLGVPLTSKRKEGSYFYPISFKNKSGSALLNQVKVLDCKRLKSRMGYITLKQHDNIKKSLIKLIDFPPQ